MSERDKNAKESEIVFVVYKAERRQMISANVGRERKKSAMIPTKWKKADIKQANRLAASSNIESFKCLYHDRT